MATKKFTLYNPNPCLNHVATVNGTVSIGPGATVEVEVNEAVAKSLEKAIERGTYGEPPKVKPVEKTDAKTANK